MRTRLLLAAAGLSVVAWAEHRRRLVRNVPAELRRPVLAVPLGLPHPAFVPLARRWLDSGSAPVVPGVRTTNLVARGTDGHPDVPLVGYEPADRAAPGGVLLWIHGGGLVMGTPAYGDERCSQIARDLGVLVLSVDYRLAPEHPYPAAIDDAATALHWVHANASELGIDPARVAVGGDSAGGGLAAALAQRAHDENVPVCFQLLVYPMLDDRTVLRRIAAAGPLLWTPLSNRTGWSAYLGHQPRWEETRPYTAAARRDDLSGLPPAWIGVGDLDLFHDEDVDYARRLGLAGVPCDLVVVPGMYHGADVIAVPRPPSMQAFWQSSVDALAAVLGAARTASPD
jgi:acetyl esterase/lipase